MTYFQHIEDMPRLHYWTCGSGRIELQMTLAEAQSVAHPGPCDADVLALSGVPSIRRQLWELSPADVRAALKDCGAWSAAELADHEANLQRLLWIAGGDIVDNHATGDA
jgi:hypothetical protein